MTVGRSRVRILVLILTLVLVAQAAWVASASAADPSPDPQVGAPASTAPDASAAPSATAAPTPTPAASAAPAASPAPTPAAPAPSPSATPPVDDPTPAPGTTAVLAPLPAGAREDVAKRTETSRTYRDASGRTTTESYLTPVFFRPDAKSALEPVRLGYVRSADGRGAVSGKAPLKVAVAPATDTDGFLAFTAGTYTIRYRPVAAKSLPASASTAAAINGGVADLKDVIPGVDLRVLARSDSASVFFILDRAADAAELQFAIDAPGLTAKVDTDGQVVFTDATGGEVARMPHPWATDSTPDTKGLGSGRIDGGVTIALTGSASPYTATVTVDPGWLKDAAYPVYVDPTLALSNDTSSEDGFVNAGHDINYNDYCRPESPFYCELWLGQSPDPMTYVGTIYMKWDVSSIMGQGIDTASLQFFPYWQYMHSTPKNTWVYQVASGTGTVPWTESGLKYSNRPRSVTGSAVQATTVEDSWSNIDIKTFVRNWTSGDYTNYGIRIDENGNNYTYWKRVISVDQTGTYVHVPRIVYTSHSLSGTPVSVGTLGSSRTLTWTYANSASRNQTQFQVEVASDSAFASIVASSGTVSQSVAPGGTGLWTVPTLTDMTKYYWRVRVNDGTGWSTRTAATVPFVYDVLQRGSEPFYTAVPFDPGGGWNLDVAVHSGEAHLSRSFYTIPGIGPDQGLDLAYSSLNVTTPGMLGYGWSSNLTQSLWRNSTTSPTLAIWNRPDGAREVFYLEGSVWKATADHFDKLAVAGTVWTITQPDQTQLVFTLGTGVSEAKLTRIVDRIGKQLAFTWNATSATITSPTTPPLTTTLNYPGGSLITSVVDPAGRTWTLGYTGSDLTLITEPDPDGGLSLAAPFTRIGYSAHLVTTIERDRRTFEVDGSETVKTPRWTVQYTSGKATGVVDPIAYASFSSVASTFTYNTGNTVAALLKTYSPAARNSTTYAYDNAGRVTQSTDPNASVTKYNWNNPSSTINYIDAPGADQSTWTRTAYTYDTAGNILTETADALGDAVTTRYTYNTSNDVLTVEEAHGTVDEVITTSEYNTAGAGGTPGHLVRVTANSADAVPANRQVTEYAYDANDLVTASWEHHAFATGESHTGRTTTHAYNGYGVETTQIENCTKSLAVLLTDTLVGGIEEWKTCGATGTPDASTNLKTQWSIGTGTAGKLGLPDTVTTGVGLTNMAVAYVYDALGRVTTETPPEGMTTRDWDQLGTEIRTTAPGPLVTRRTLDLMNQVTTEVAPLWTTETQYDATGSITRRTTANDVVSQAYDGAGRLLSETIDPGLSPHLNLTTDHAYDAAGHEIAVRAPDLTVTRTFYDAQDRVTAVVENCTSSDGSPWSACKGDGIADATTNVATRYGYDARGNKISETAPSGRLTTFVYDDLDRLIKQVDNDVATVTLPTQDVTTEYAYDADGNQVAVKAPTAAGGANGYHVTRSFFDALGHVTRTIANCTDSGTTPPAAWQTCAGGGTWDAATNVGTTYTYDADGSRLSMTAPSPAATSGTSGDYLSTVTTRYAYDTAGRLCRVLENAQEAFQAGNPCSVALTVTPTATSNVDTKYGYDTRGNLSTMVDGRGNTTNYGYDNRGRMTSLAEPGVAALIWVYNDVARTKTQTNRTTGTVVWTYDAAGRIVSRAYQDAQGFPQTTTYSYPSGTQNWTAQDATGTITVTNDRLGRPTNVAVSSDAGAATTYGYSFTAPTRTDASGSYTIATDNVGRVTAIDDPIHASNWTFGYGANGEPVTTVWPTTTALTRTSGYDALGRLTSRSTTPGPVASYSLAYNRAGRRLSEASSVTGDTSNGTATTGYDPLGRHSSYGLPALSKTINAGWDAVPNRTTLITDGTPVTTTFDAANRPTSGGYLYDADGRMTTRAGSAGTTLAYDSLGRLAEVRQNPGNTLVARYTYDALDRLLTVERSTGRIRFRYQGASTAVAQVVDDIAGTVTRNVTVGPEGTVLQDWLGADRRLYGTNAHHDTTWTANDAGTVTATLRYDPWGNLLRSSGSSLPDWRFQGSWAETSTNLAWSVARWYDPVQGTFISEDTLLGEPANPGSRHLYAYGAGDPVGSWDPGGLLSFGFGGFSTTGFGQRDSGEMPGGYFVYAKAESWAGAPSYAAARLVARSQVRRPLLPYYSYTISIRADRLDVEHWKEIGVGGVFAATDTVIVKVYRKKPGESSWKRIINWTTKENELTGCGGLAWVIGPCLPNIEGRKGPWSDSWGPRSGISTRIDPLDAVRMELQLDVRATTGGIWTFGSTRLEMSGIRAALTRRW